MLPRSCDSAKPARRRMSFEDLDRKAAEDWGGEQEALIRRNLWLDPRDGGTGFDDLAEERLDAVSPRLELNTVAGSSARERIRRPEPDPESQSIATATPDGSATNRHGTGSMSTTPVSGLRVTPDRQKVVDFSEPIGYDDAVAVYPQKETGITGPESIKGKSVCVVAGSSNGEAPVQRIGGAAKMTRYPGQAEAFSDLKNGRCDLMVTGRILALYWIKSGDGAGYAVSQNGTDGTALAVGVPKGSDALLQAVNKAIDDAKKTGAYVSIAQKWLGQPFKQ
ncbi:transporter substrate-binding domain-containing protein [Amycolatopsis sp. NPDC050768]|uniref:substrate-binding periplasmic protein n=1 Tax=Amycolatopsis sp. NPDC050768 TaxID=3154839 RepID=UPI0033E4D82E